jgi:CBS domain
MSPRAAWRLETLGFVAAYDYVGGKADWLAHNLPREGERAGEPTAGDLLGDERPTCRLADDLATITAVLERTHHGFCLAVTNRDIVLGRVRRSALEDALAGATAEQLMEPGPSTVRADTPARDLVERLASRDLRTAIVTTPEGRLLGLFSRTAAELRLREE